MENVSARYSGRVGTRIKNENDIKKPARHTKM